MLIPLLLLATTPTPPPPPPPRPRRRFAGAAGGGGGGWQPDCDPDDPDDPYCEPIDPATPPTEELGDAAPATSVAKTLANFIKGGSIGFVGSNVITKLAEHHFGRHGGGVAAVGSVVATSAAAGKWAKASKTGEKLEGPMVIGSVLAAVDNLVDIYVNERGAKADPLVVHMPDVASFVAKAQQVGSLVVSQSMGTRKSTGVRVLVLRYRSASRKHPPTTYLYTELVEQSLDGHFVINGTLLQAIRKVRRGG